MAHRVGLSLVFVALAWGCAAADSSQPPAKVGDEATKLLAATMSIKVSEMKLDQALEWYQRLTENPVPIFASEGASAKKVTLELVDASWAEALRKIAAQTGVKYRVVKGVIQIATPEEFEAIDKGTAEFKPFVRPAPPKPAAPVIEPEKTPVVLPKNSILNAKVGDWTEFTYTYIVKEGTDVKYIKFTVESMRQSDAGVWIVVAMDWSSPELNWKKHQTVEICPKFYGSYRPSNELLWGGEAKLPNDKETEGDETLVVGGKSYASHFVEREYHDAKHHDTTTISVKTWTSKEIPVGGMLKCVRKYPEMTNILEFTGSGSKN